MVRVVEQHAARAEGRAVVLVAVLVEGDEHVGAVTGGEDVPGAHADLEDGRTARDGGWDRHVVMTSWSERPARRARKPSTAWIPSCELPASRMTTSGMEVADDAFASVVGRRGGIRADHNGVGKGTPGVPHSKSATMQRRVSSITATGVDCQGSVKTGQGGSLQNRPL